jgi:3-methyladenine DNA glycosylase/8-oxoguanine DNA glycosylase
MKDIIQVAQDCQPFYVLPEGDLYHHLISLIIAQKIRFSVGRTIRQKLYQLVNSDRYERTTVLALSDDQLRTIGLSPEKIALIRKVSEIPHLEINSLSTIKGIGPWTIGALKLLMGVEEEFFLAEDSYIRQRVAEYFSVKTLTIPQCRALSQREWTGHQCMMSKFFWRIKPEGVVCLHTDSELQRTHFL